jgi:hypothetical protein
MIKQKYLDLLQDLSTEKNTHSGKSLFNHLKGTYGLLKQWGNPEYICVAGLFHSIYGTQYYAVQSARLSDRKHIIDIIGSQAEELAYLFCTTDRTGFFTEANKENPVLIDTKNQYPVPVNKAILTALIEIEVANLIEQITPENASESRTRRLKAMLEAGRDKMSKNAEIEFACFLQKL